MPVPACAGIPTGYTGRIPAFAFPGCPDSAGCAGIPSGYAQPFFTSR